MLVARRDPFHPGAHDAPYADDVQSGNPRLARTVSMLQVVGSLLAIPVGLASAYSIYRANFSVETTCQGLRADIIAMIDKRVDASTRRILARRDVERFEQTCGATDPDATAAFKELLAGNKPPAAAPPAAAPAPQTAAAPAKEIAHHPETVAKLPASAWPGSERARRDAGVSDTLWLDAVRQALVTHDAGRKNAERTEEAAAPAVPPVLRPAIRETAAPVPVPAMTPAVAPAAAPAAAPVLPPPAAIAAPVVPPSPRQTDADHPVPPAAIPDPAEAANAQTNEHRSTVRRWIAKIPLMGNVIDNGLQ